MILLTSKKMSNQTTITYSLNQRHNLVGFNTNNVAKAFHFECGKKV